uniref:Secreted protein n=1 Tax=Achlya hypogyna TaxID=1202772 RepID=A0A0A7CMK1_ACHHY|nr:secreted protein [Achlya hypogyna]
MLRFFVLAVAAASTVTASSGVFYLKAEPKVETLRSAYLKAATDCITKTQEPTIGSFLKAVPATLATPAVLVADVGATDLATPGCPKVGPAFQRYAKELNGTVGGFLKALPLKGYTVSVADALDCTFALPTTGATVKGWWSSGLLKASDGTATVGAHKCSSTTVALALKDGSVVLPPPSGPALTVVLDQTVALDGAIHAVGVFSYKVNSWVRYDAASIMHYPHL